MVDEMGFMDHLAAVEGNLVYLEVSFVAAVEEETVFVGGLVVWLT